MTAPRRPYYAADPAWWPELLELLPRPLVVKAVLHDLRYLENEGRRGGIFPSHRELRDRWGWSRRKVDRALNGELGDWHDERSPLTLEQLRSVGGVNRGGGSLHEATPTAAITPRTEEPEETADSGHTEAGQLSTGAGTPLGTPLGTGVGTGVGTPQTHKPGESSKIGHGSGHGSGHGGGHTSGHTPLRKGWANLGRTPPQPDQPDQPDQQTTVAKDRDGGDLGEVIELKLQPGGADQGATPTPEQSRTAAARRVYAHWFASWHPRASSEPTDDQLAAISGRVRATARLERRQKHADPIERATQLLVLVVDWIHSAPDAAFFQGFNKNGPDGKGQKYLKISTIFKVDKWGDRLEAARAWAAAGRPTNPEIGLQDYRGEADRAWSHLQDLVRSGQLPDQLHPERDKEAAFRAAIAAVGLSDVKRATRAQRAALSERFVTAYCTARRDHRAGSNSTIAGTHRRKF